MCKNMAGLLILTLLSAGGCAATDNKVTLSSEYKITLERVRTRGVTVASARTDITEDGLVVCGTVRRDRLYGGFSHGHVHVFVISPDQHELADARQDYRPQSLPPRKLLRAYFEVPLSHIPPDGSTVRVVRHAPGECDPT